jgi:hypothetical protein
LLHLRHKADGRASDDGSDLRQTTTDASNALRFKNPWDPRLRDILVGGQHGPTLQGMAVANRPASGSDSAPLVSYYGDLEVSDNGMARYFRAAIARPMPVGAGPNAPTRLLLRDPAASQIVAQFSFQ